MKPNRWDFKWKYCVEWTLYRDWKISAMILRNWEQKIWTEIPAFVTHGTKKRWPNQDEAKCWVRIIFVHIPAIQHETQKIFWSNSKNLTTNESWKWSIL